MRDKHKSARLIPGRRLLCYAEAVALMNRVNAPMTVLDFGCGPGFYQREMLVAASHGGVVAGYQPTSGRSSYPELKMAWDLVICSNVFNVQSSNEERHQLMTDLVSVTKRTGTLVTNYPSEPRYDPDFTRMDFERLLRWHWMVVDNRGKGVYVCALAG